MSEPAGGAQGRGPSAAGDALSAGTASRTGTSGAAGLQRPASGCRRAGCALAALTLALLTAGHWAYWYRPRPHALAPASARLLRERIERGGTPAWAVRLWVPFPHQNLGALGGAVERPREVLAAASRLAGLPAPAIPRLGPFTIPPARELLVASSPDGSRLAAAVRLYPTVAVLTRLAGMLARNPLLAGGELALRGRRAQVWWEGWTWHLESTAGGAAAEGPASADETAAAPLAAMGSDDGAPALALVELGAAAAPLPAGRYTLRREGADLVWRLGAELAAPAAGPPSGVILVWVERRPAAGGAPHEQALLLMERVDDGPLQSLPGAAAWARPRGALKVLPGGSILRQLTGVRAVPFGGGELAATERAAARRAEELAPSWLPLAGGDSRPPVAVGGWLAVAPAEQEAEALHLLLEEVPLLGAAEAQRWGDVATVLRAARGYRTLSCWLAADGSSGELRLRR